MCVCGKAVGITAGMRIGNVLDNLVYNTVIQEYTPVVAIAKTLWLEFMIN